jgi:hypothetical protein
LTSLGGKGKGPGEFDVIANIKIGLKYLYATDIFLPRINVYSLASLDFSFMILMKPSHWNYIQKLRDKIPRRLDFLVGKRGQLLIPFHPAIPASHFKSTKAFAKYKQMNYLYYYWMNSKGKVTPPQILKLKAASGIRTPQGQIFNDSRNPIYGSSLLAVSQNGLLFTAWSDHFAIKIFNSKGHYVRTICYAYKNASLHRQTLLKPNIIKAAEASPQFESVLSTIKHMNLPPTWPALHSLRVDDQGRLWVSTIVKNQKVYKWWILNKEGKLLARFIWPRDKPIQDIKNNYLYATVRNKEGVARIVRYKIQMHHSENAANP